VPVQHYDGRSRWRHAGGPGVPATVRLQPRPL